MSNSGCRAVDPATCKYHGKGRKSKIVPFRRAEARLNAAQFSLNAYSDSQNAVGKLLREFEQAQEDYDCTSYGFKALQEEFYKVSTLGNPVQRQQLETRLRKASLRRQAVESYTSNKNLNPDTFRQVWESSDSTNTVSFDEFKVIRGASEDGVNFCFYIFTSDGEPVTSGLGRVNDIRSLTGLKHVAELYLSYYPKPIINSS